MTLVELVVSSVVLAGSSSAALGVWNQAANEIQGAKQWEELALQLESTRIATHRWLQSAPVSADLLDPRSPDCRFNGTALETAVVDRLPIGSDVRSRWIPDPQGLGYWLELSAVSQAQAPPLKRRLLFTPAAYGLCQPEALSS